LLQLLIGRAKTGKSESVLRRIAELGDRSRQILLVPEHASHQAEVDLCRFCGDTASRHAEVLSFRRLASRVLSVTGGISDVTLDAGGRLLTLQKAISETAPVLRVFRRPSRRAVFLSELLDLFDEFRSYGVTPEALSDASGTLAGATGEKLGDLALLYGAYEARLCRPGFDARDRMTKLCDHLEESGYADGKDVFVDGFTYFNGQEQRVLSVLLRRAASVTVTLLGERNSRSEIFAASLRTQETLLRLAQEAGCQARVSYLTARDDSPLGHLERCFFGPTETWEGPAEGIRVRQAQSAYSEVEWAASEIRRLAAAGRCRYRDVIVAARNMPEYEPIIENVFARYGIPVYMSRRSDILETPVMALLTGALDAVTGGFEYEDLFRCLKTGLAGLEMEECDRLENYVLRWEIHGAMWLRPVAWTANPDGYGAPWGESQTAALADVNALRERVRGPLSELADGLKAAGTADEKVDALYRYLERLDLQHALEERMRRQAEAGELQAAEETGQLWEVLCGVLDQYAAVLQGVSMETEEFVRLLRLLLTQYSVGTIPASLDQAAVSEITRNDRHTVQYLFLLGANDHVLPAVGESGGILNDDDRGELARCGIRLAPAGMEQMGIELQNLYAALAQPTRGLAVSYPAFDVSGAELRPSFAVGRILTLFPSLRLEQESADKEYRLTAVQPALEAAGEDPDGPLWRYFASRERFSGSLAAMERAAALRRGRLSRDAVTALYGQRFSMSASRAEKLNSCHFAYFMQYGLRAQPRRDAEFDAPEVGTFLHFVLESVTREAMARGGFAQVDDAVLRELTDAAIETYSQRELANFRDRPARFRYLFSRLRRTVWSVVREAAEELRHSDFVPLAFELSFGDRGTLPAVSVREPGCELRLTGKVDRVDGWVKDDKLYLRVVDYKTGKKTFDLAEVRMGLDIQMLLYLFALQREGRDHFGREIEPAGVLYFPARDELLTQERSVTPEQLGTLRAKALRRSGLVLGEPEVLRAMEHEALTEPQFLPVRVSRSGDLSGAIASAAELGRLERYVQKLLRRIAAELRDGDIDADPCCRSEDDTFCRWCDWNAACHFEDGRDRDRLRYITPVKPADFWQQIDESTKGGGDHA
jgi:ATP-dependent helicase/nuclease subunit B